LSGLRPFIAELKRRRVWRVVVVYAVTALAVVEAADLFFPRLALPEWSVTLVVVLSVLGFPIAVVLAWAFETSPEGVRRTEAAPGDVALESARRGVLFAAAAGIALVAGGGWWLLAASGGGSAPTIERIAVLPLSNLMDDPEQEYFVQGMHDRLISELQQAGIAVIARTSVLRYGAAGTPVREIARELGVDAVIEGSVFRAGDSVAIEARLVDGASEEYLWRESFGGSLRNVAALHRDLSRAIAEEIQAALGPEEQARLSQARPVDPQAYEAYLKGLFHLQRFNEADLNTALEYFDAALEIDSTYAPAYVGIARVWGSRGQSGLASPPEARDKREPVLERALALDSTLAEAHMAVATSRTWGDWDWEAGEEAFRRAIELNPGYADAHMFYGHLLTILGRWEEAAEQVESGRQLDPLNPFVQGLYAVQRAMARDYDDAIDVLEEMFRRNPGAGFGRVPLSGLYHLEGRYEEALRKIRNEFEARGERDVVAALDRGYVEAGYCGALRLAAVALAARAGDEADDEYVAPNRVAQFYAMAGEVEKAVEWLEEAFEARQGNMPYIGVIPIYEGLHDHPRFRELARRMNVPS